MFLDFTLTIAILECRYWMTTVSIIKSILLFQGTITSLKDSITTIPFWMHVRSIKACTELFVVFVLTKELACIAKYPHNLLQYR